jgi:hypothetical protein
VHHLLSYELNMYIQYGNVKINGFNTATIFDVNRILTYYLPRLMYANKMKFEGDTDREAQFTTFGIGI